MSELTVQYLVLEPCDPARNMARFYVLTIEPTLFGDTALLREWVASASGRRRLDLFVGPGCRAAEALETWLVRKARRGLLPAKPHSCSERFRPPQQQSRQQS